MKWITFPSGDGTKRVLVYEPSEAADVERLIRAVDGDAICVSRITDVTDWDFDGESKDDCA